jgi:hypothetical protein
MNFICMFRECRWVWHFNAEASGLILGVYQCSRCKTISIGAPRDPMHPMNFLRSGVEELQKVTSTRGKITPWTPPTE